MSQTSQQRRRFLQRSLAATGALLLGGCDYLAASLTDIRGGHGGYWEDSNGYQWYAGI